jgi:hypothetical protein
MADAKSAADFFRKVVHFVANPTADGFATPKIETSRLARSELSALVERKRRNDFVRRQEFGYLRQMRRERLSPEKRAALGDASKAADAEVMATEHNVLKHCETGVKAKIDAIEQQMSSAGGRPVASLHAATAGSTRTTSRAVGQISSSTRIAAKALCAPDPAAHRATPPTRPMPDPVSLRPDIDLSDLSPAPRTHARTRTGALSLPTSRWPTLRDPELDEAVIAFANADFGRCEQLLMVLCRPTGERQRHRTSWRLLLDLYRATDQALKFDMLALDYARMFGRPLPSAMLDNRLAARPVCRFELSGHLSGDISTQLQQIDRQLGSVRGVQASYVQVSCVQVSCAKLIRVDFIAAGDLLNWVLAKKAEQRSVSFTDAHRLLALFLGVIGLDEQAQVSIPRD